MCMAKAVRSTVVIMPPRNLWPSIQALRTRLVEELRSGPHITLAFPFVPENQFPEVASKLRARLSKLQPFSITLQKFDMFSKKKTAILFLDPQVTPSNSLNELQAEIVAEYPLCNDVNKKENGFHPHLSIGNFVGLYARERALDYANNHAKTFADNPITFQVNEIYVLSRNLEDPFEVKEVVKIGDNADIPHFGPKSSEMSNVLFVGNIPREVSFTSDSLKTIFPTCTGTEIITQPYGTSRGVAWVTFETKEEAKKICGEKLPQISVGNPPQQIVILFACQMAYP